MSGPSHARDDKTFGPRAEKVAEALGVARVLCLGGDSKRYIDALRRTHAIVVSEQQKEEADAWLLATHISSLQDVERLAIPPCGKVLRLVVGVTLDGDLARAIMGAGGHLREHVERHMIVVGWRKHPSSCHFADYEVMGSEEGELVAVFEPVPEEALETFPLEMLSLRRDLHMDMLRESGVRSDAHLVRYEWAASMIRPGDRVLDAACGMGYGTHILSVRSDASAVVGIDGSEFAIAYASENYRSERVGFEIGSLPETLNRYEDGAFDCIVTFETLEHVEAPQALLQEFARLLVPGGRVLVSVPNDWADDTGEDPNPHHLHVYTWEKLQEQISRHFLVETPWRQIASGCKQGKPRVWRPSSRAFSPIAPSAATHTDAEWWLLSAMKSPLSDAGAISFRDLSCAEFEGRSLLVDFSNHYRNPWIVRSMVEIPYRLRDTGGLTELARELQDVSEGTTPDYGAALAIEGYRLLEAGSCDEVAISDWLSRSAAYAPGPVRNSQISRWLVSLAFLSGALQLRMGDVEGAERSYRNCLGQDYIATTPTLGTKIVEAAFRLGMIAYSGGRIDEAKDAWRSGLAHADACIKQDMREFIGNWAKPYEFAMNDLLEIVDGAVRCAAALRVADSKRSSASIALAEISRKSMRSALGRLTADLHAITKAKAEFERMLGEIRHELGEAHSQSLMLLGLAEDRARYIAELERKFSSLEETSVERLSQAERLDRALNEAQALSLQRLEEIKRLDAALSEEQARSMERMYLSQKLDAALGDAQTLSLDRLEESKRLDLALSEEQARSMERMRLSQELDLALGEAQRLSIERLDEIGQLVAALDEEKERCAALEAHGATLSVHAGELRSQLYETERKYIEVKEHRDRIVNSRCYRFSEFLRKAFGRQAG